MARNLSGKRVAVLVDNGFEQVELTSPIEALRDAGAEAVVVSPQQDKVRAWDRKDWGETFDVDMPLDRARADDFDALVLPGGVMNPDHLRTNERAVQFTRAFFDAGKPVASICHGPWLLAEANVVRGRRLTSYPSLRTDLRNAGAEWVDESVVVDSGLVTSRNPDDLPDFNRKMVEEIAEGVHAGQSA
ncbi:MAG TPA: type 1 glutamine amidotransferase domain-containing protein [Longimicrobiales bacterium]|nr:type 1 glutamine amidotransferase domain-containing protein [Longimicrobiales bacterium]